MLRCILCSSFSLEHICKSCQEQFLQPHVLKQEILPDFEVISFYQYTDIEELLKTKHTNLGYYVYKVLAKCSFRKFAKAFKSEEFISSVGVDERVKEFYSHTAILNKALKSSCIKPSFAKLLAQNDVSYSAKSLQYRLDNPRDFLLKPLKHKDVILIDDIITTGTTLKEAYMTLLKNDYNPLFALTLASVEKPKEKNEKNIINE